MAERFEVARLKARAAYKGHESDRAIAAFLGIPRTRVAAWGDWFVIETADDLQMVDGLACAFGSHPKDLWPNWLEASLSIGFDAEELGADPYEAQVHVEAVAA